MSPGGYRIACDEYHLPRSVQKHVDFAFPTIHLEGLGPVPNALAMGEDTVSPRIEGVMGYEDCYDGMGIQCLRKLYQFGPGNTSAKWNHLGIPAWGSYLNYSDLPLYFDKFTTQPIPSTVWPELVSIDGGLHLTNDNGLVRGREASLDVQTAYAIIYPQDVMYYQVGDSYVDITGSFNTFLDALDKSYCSYLGGDAPYFDPIYPNVEPGGYDGPLNCGNAPPSNVLSFSYLQIEAGLPQSYQIRQCNEYMKLGLQGVSVLFASGDWGVASQGASEFNSSCMTPKEMGDFLDEDGPRFSPSFPANCPWVTTVGGTFLKTRNISDGEIAVGVPNATNPKRDFYSGGGFSNLFSRPSYQENAVGGYLSTYPPPYSDGIYNPGGRAYPDISAIAMNIPSVMAGMARVGGGTSAATPIVAGIVTLLNEARIAAGKGPIGFLNPTLYAHPEAFNDVVEGSNPGCGTDGFKAQPGWDPVTGLGTPRYPKLEEIFLSLP